MAVVAAHDLFKLFGDVRAVNGISFDVGEGEFVTLLGESGCGKTTTLRSIAGLEEIDEGRIILGGEVVSDPKAGILVPPEKRGIGMVFQSYAIWPHMTVFGNVAFPLKVRRLPRSEIRERVERVLELVDLGDLAPRLATQLSGGQQQRVAIARALACDPAILLMDEPLSNLDAKLRERMRFELREMQKRLGIPTLYVTHDQAEAMVLSDRIIVMREGRIEQVGTPLEVYEFPKSEFVSDFIGMANLFAARVKASQDEKCCLQLTGNGRELVLPGKPPEAGNVLVMIRPENVRLGASADLPAENTWPTRVDANAYFGDHRQYILRDGDLTIRAKTETRVVFNRGDSVVVHIPPESIVLIG